MKNRGKIALTVGVLILVALFFALDLKQYLTLSYIKDQQDLFSQYYRNNPVTTIVAYMLIYVVMAALSLPGAALLTLLGGALFGVFAGTLIVSFASSLGATLAFLGARFLLQEWVQKNFAKHLVKINKGFEKEGALYLFTLRLIPAFPFFVVNLVMGLTRMKAFTFYWVSQVGMLAGTAVYVNAGTQLSQIESPKGLISPSLLASFAALGLFPIVTKKIVAHFKKGKLPNA